MELIGRETCIAAVDSLLVRLPDEGGALVLRGEAGIGKSAVLRAVARAAAAERGVTTLSAVGVESEAHLPYAGLHQLLSPLLATGADLPPAQRAALDRAFGLPAAGAPAGGGGDLFAVALAVMHLLAEAAAAAPLLLAVDDAQWLDPATLDVLAFLARRLDAEPVVLLATARDGVPSRLDVARLPELTLEPLGAADAARVLDATAPDLTAALRARVLAEAAGNPLGLVELPVAVRAEQGAGGAAIPPAVLPLTTRLEHAFAARTAELPPATRALLLVAAIDDQCTLDETLAAAGVALGQPVDLADAGHALDAELVVLDGARVRFRHPLVRSAVHAAATLPQRHAAHAALAAGLADQPERRAWHRAASTIGCDEEVAVALEAAAESARRRGAVTAAASALERAAQLSHDGPAKADRLLRAAELAFELGLHDAVRDLLEQAAPLDVDPYQAARIRWQQQIVSGGIWSGAMPVPAFVALARRLGGHGDQRFAIAQLVPVALRCWWSNPPAETRGLLVDAASSLPLDRHDPALLAVVALADPEAQAAAIVERVGALRPTDLGAAEGLLNVGLAAGAVGAWRHAYDFLDAAVEQLRAQSRLGLLTQALLYHAWSAMHTGDLGLASASAEECLRLAGDTMQPRYGVTAGLVVAHVAARRGSAGEDDARIARGERALVKMKAYSMLAPAHLARGAAAIGDGRHEAAYEHLRPVFDVADPAFHRSIRHWAVQDLVEAAVHSGRADEARAIVAGLEPAAAGVSSGASVLRAGLAAARPLLAPDDQADALFERALEDDLRAWPYLRARTLLAHGAWLRRRRRVAESRRPLRAGRDLFEAIGARKWNERARQELRATGESSGRREPDARDQLTAQELQIAELAAAGMTNREIGERLFLSHRTIGSHLYRVFPKLGISARSELAGALARAEAGAAV